MAYKISNSFDLHKQEKKMMNALYWFQYFLILIKIVLFSIFTYIKIRLFGKSKSISSLSNRDCQIAIIGGGIGGVGAAYALVESGYKNVTIFEAREQLGGNAKTHVWQNEITTGLSVLAWPEIFRNYIHLLKKLDIQTTTVQLPFFLQNKTDNFIFAHGKSSDYKRELFRWNQMVKLVRQVTEFLCGTERSLYHFSIVNPFNYIPLRLLSMLFGISNYFWTNIVVPMYASSFLSTKLSFIPSSILPTLDSLISLQCERIPTMQSWCQTSIDVFEQMTRNIIKKTNHHVEKIRIEKLSNEQIRIFIDDESTVYDRIIFACNPKATMQALNYGQTKTSSLLNLLLSSVTYSDDDNDTSLLDGFIHRDRNILPKEYVDELCRTYANYIDIKYDKQTEEFYHYNTFILSSWLPNVNSMYRDKQIEPMLVTYASYDKPMPAIDSKKIYGKVDNRGAHPSLSFRNQLIALSIRFVQGEDGMFFCGNSVTPANGHDLSLLSGFAVAELIGAKYPFADNVEAWRDYQRFKRMCIN